MSRSQKRLAAKSPSRTVPETASTTAILTRFRAATDIVDAAKAGGEPVFDFLRFGFCDVVFADIACPEIGGPGPFRPGPDAFPVEVCPPDLRSPLHARGRESLTGLVNQS